MLDSSKHSINTSRSGYLPFLSHSENVSLVRLLSNFLTQVLAMIEASGDRSTRFFPIFL